MEDILKQLLEKNDAQYVLACLTVLIVTLMFFSYYYKMLRLNKRSALKELQIKHDVIEDSNKENNNKEFINKILRLNISNNLFDNDLKSEDKFIYKLLNLHHEQALQQSSIQFWFSIVAAVIGFVFIILIISLSNDNKWYDYVCKIFPGAIIETVSVLFINQARETRDKATKFFTELNYQMQIEKSVKIADSIERDEIRADVKAKIALHIIGINEELDNK